MNHNTRRTEIVVIGAGMSGLAAATELKRSGMQVLVLDKARGVGGRLANRRIDGAVFDHGAQFVTARDDRFVALLADWHKQGIVKEWYRNNLNDGGGHPRFCGSPTMSAIGKELARNLDLLLQGSVTAIQLDGDKWSVHLREGERIQAKAVVMTPPVPQSLAILDAGNVAISGTTRSRLEKIKYEKCFAIMAILDGPSLIPAPGSLKPETGPIAWIADNQTKGISELTAVTIHATGEYSEANWEGDRDKVAQELLFASQQWLGASVVKYQVHGWRYSKPVTTDEDRCSVINQHPPLIIAGDAFGGPRVEGAALSGWAAAETLLQLCLREQKSG
ncbi:MAG: FAD-dependent oxidoreductase [Verrucomicrobia bacterium]|nr:FAD-dependent oxidoreductase [Verrucomicrobiota bacterium]MDA1065628.1 FAD-dependent oxidoreductase [Verrucomicrobiota bacterium]